MVPQIVGLIVPPSQDVVPPEALELYPDGVDFVAHGLGVDNMTPLEFSLALERLPAAIESLLLKGAEAICLMGTSISFYLGREKHQQLLSDMRSVAGAVPVSTMTDAIVEGLRNRKMKKIVVATAYELPVSQALLDFLRNDGFEVLADEHLNVKEISQLQSFDTKQLERLGAGLLSSNPLCDGLLISCGGLRTRTVTELLEKKFRKPVVSSAVQGCHHAVELLKKVE